MESKSEDLDSSEHLQKIKTGTNFKQVHPYELPRRVGTRKFLTSFLRGAW